MWLAVSIWSNRDLSQASANIQCVPCKQQGARTHFYCGDHNLSILMMSSVTRSPAGLCCSLLLLRSPSAPIITLSAGFYCKPHFARQLLSNGMFTPKGCFFFYVFSGSGKHVEPWGTGGQVLLLEHRTNPIIPFSANTNSHPSFETGWQ